MLWISWMRIVWQLRPAFSREKTFYWFILVMIGMTIRTDHMGMASLMRALNLKDSGYQSLCDFFHSDAINLRKLTEIWGKIVFSIFSPFLVKYKGRVIFLIDGIKAPKEGQRMPGVKKMFQNSSNNSKAPFIWGHSCQGLSILVCSGKYFLSVPLILRIQEGLGGISKSIILKGIDLLKTFELNFPAILVGDNYYFSGEFCGELSKMGIALVSRVRSNAVAYGVPSKNRKKGRGRPQKYGSKVYLKDLYKGPGFKRKKVLLYGKEETVEIKEKILISKSHKGAVKFVLVKRENGDRAILASTDIKLLAKEIVEIYGHRFKIEVSFKEMVHRIGAFGYRFWSKSVTKSRKTGEVKKDLRKETSYQLFLQISVITQGLLNYLAIQYKEKIWGSFRGWLRTIRPEIIPSEQVVMMSLRSGAFEFLKGKEIDLNLRKFYSGKERLDFKGHQAMAS